MHSLALGRACPLSQAECRLSGKATAKSVGWGSSSTLFLRNNFCSFTLFLRNNFLFYLLGLDSDTEQAFCWILFFRLWYQTIWVGTWSTWFLARVMGLAIFSCIFPTPLLMPLSHFLLTLNISLNPDPGTDQLQSARIRNTWQGMGRL